MKITTRTSSDDNRVLELSSLLGIVVGLGMLVPAYLSAEGAYLAAPALAVLLPSLLYGAR